MKKKIIWIISIFLFIIISYLHLTTLDNRLGHLILFILVVIPCIALIIVGAIIFLIKKKHLLIILGLILLLINCISILPSAIVNYYDTSATEKNAQMIIESINKYYKDNKSNPKSLDELIPKYMTTIPKRIKLLSKDTEFEYFLDVDGTYALIYDNDSIPMVYYSKDKMWYANPKG